MTDYYIGLAVGALIGYGLSLVTMIMLWALCVIAKKEDERDKNDITVEDIVIWVSIFIAFILCVVMAWILTEI